MLVDMIGEGMKVKAELARVLTDEHTKEFIKHGVWPKKFTNKRPIPFDEDDNGLQKNLNRQALQESEDTDDSSSEN